MRKIPAITIGLASTAPPVARAQQPNLDAIVEAYDSSYGLMTLAVRGGHFLVPAPPDVIGHRHRLRVFAGDVSLARVPSQASTILNDLPARILSTTKRREHEIVVVLGLGTEGAGERLLARVTRRSWDQLDLAEGMLVHAQVKGVALVQRPRHDALSCSSVIARRK